MYATLAYSKVVIDEIQGYSPEIVAVILKGLEMIHAIGGKFMVMTATLPRIYKEQLEKMAKEGPSAEHMQKIKEYMLKKYKDAQKENGYWLNNLDEYFYTGIDNTKDYEKLVNSITAKEVQDFLAKLLKQNNEIQVVMTMPEENK